MTPPTMRAVRVEAATGHVVVQSVRRPRPAAGQVLVRVAAAGLGRPDVELVAGRGGLRPDASGWRTLGREVAGVVAAPGAGVDGWPLGRRVALRSSVRMPRGRFALGVDQEGGWADYVVAPVESLVLLPDVVPFEQAAVLDVVATAWSALARTGGLRPGEAVGIWGVGGLGTHAVQVARLLGAAPIVAIDPRPEARQRALGLGADAALDPEDASFDADLRGVNGGRLLDVALHAAGSGAPQVLASLATDGRAVLLGGSAAGALGDVVDPWADGKCLLGHAGPLPEDVPLLLRLITHRRLDLSSSVTDVLPLEEAPAALERLVADDGRTVRVVLRPGAAPALPGTG
ncbi:zinc-binding dehydrogenase [Geodermatophilus sabuli]|uniref:zinc-binding dehydrogenase n=1 Tax=Geodermatophilus sabuli TaxID=1564158 RepID=UPI00117BA76A|nr:zinc-binding dehydrogenase [Geodermatophilus sabuli]MBB3082378.1 threonine dehydrogenase-like Zn-dependent dehydrogenase [Geodermatophilus sabuli]